jgi:hypothetical protein
MKWINFDPQIQSKDWINFDPVLGLDQYTSPGIQYYHVSKIKQYDWLIYSWIIEFEITYCRIPPTLDKRSGLHPPQQAFHIPPQVFDDLIVDVRLRNLQLPVKNSLAKTIRVAE